LDYKTYIFGDSITHGRIGSSYTRHLSKSVRPYGVDGSTFLQTKERLFTFLENNPPTTKETYIFQSGTNDLLIPHMHALGGAWALSSQQKMDAPNGPLRDDQDFERELHLMMKEIHLLYGDISFKMCTLFPIGEVLTSSLNNKREKRNEMIKRAISHYESFGVCDIAYEAEQSLKEIADPSDYLLGSPQTLFEDGLYIQGDEQKIQHLSDQRRLYLTLDGVHPNKSGAKMIASALQQCLLHGRPTF
jgi:hypothetical protein